MINNNNKDEIVLEFRKRRIFVKMVDAHKPQAINYIVRLCSKSTLCYFDYDELSVDELFETTCFGVFFTNIVRTGISIVSF